MLLTISWIQENACKQSALDKLISFVQEKLQFILDLTTCPCQYIHY